MSLLLQGSGLGLLGYGQQPYSETSDSCERNFSDISVILITGPFLFFFFREGALERLDLETAVLHLACTAVTTVAEGMSIRLSSPSISLR